MGKLGLRLTPLTLPPTKLNTGSKCTEERPSYHFEGCGIVLQVKLPFSFRLVLIIALS